MLFGPHDESLPEIDIPVERLDQMLGEIKRNSRHRRIAMVATVLFGAAVMAALIAAPPEHGGLALTADAEISDPELPRVFGSNGVWRLAEPIEDGPEAPGPASVIEAQTDPAAPSFSLSPPDEEDLNSLPTSTSTPPTSTSGQSPDIADEPVEDPADLDWSNFRPVIRIETDDIAADDTATADDVTADDTATADDATADETVVDTAVTADDAASAAETAAAPGIEPPSSTPEESSDASATDDPTTASDELTVAAEPQPEIGDQSGANPSTPPTDPTDSDSLAFSSTPATIVAQSVLVYSAHVKVTVQVVDSDSSVVDWCNTRVDWGDGSVSRVSGADDAALCTASCERSATSSASGISEIMTFEHDYLQTIDASPRIFVATGDGCSYTLAELQLAPFTVVPPR